MTQAKTVFGYGQCNWMLQTDVSVVLLDPGLNGMPNVNLTTLAGYVVRAWSIFLGGGG